MLVTFVAKNRARVARDGAIHSSVLPNNRYRTEANERYPASRIGRGNTMAMLSNDHGKPNEATARIAPVDLTYTAHRE